MVQAIGAAAESDSSLAALRKVGAAGRPRETREQFDQLARGLDLAIVRVLLTRPGDFDSGRRVLEECRPAN